MQNRCDAFYLAYIFYDDFGVGSQLKKFQANGAAERVLNVASLRHPGPLDILCQAPQLFSISHRADDVVFQLYFVAIALGMSVRSYLTRLFFCLVYYQRDLTCSILLLRQESTSNVVNRVEVCRNSCRLQDLLSSFPFNNRRSSLRASLIRENGAPFIARSAFPGWTWTPASENDWQAICSHGRVLEAREQTLEQRTRVWLYIAPTFQSN